MPLDGFTLNLLIRELKNEIIGCRIEKIHQPSNDEIVFHLRSRQGAKKLYISAHSSKESQAAYKALGCVYATEIIPWIAEEEPYDVQMEYIL